MLDMSVQISAVLVVALLGSLLEFSETLYIDDSNIPDEIAFNNESEDEMHRYDKDIDIRQAIRPNPGCPNRWPDGKVLYRFDNAKYPLAKKYRKRLVKAMKVWEQFTCLSFTDIGDDPSRWNETHIFVEDIPGMGCSTLIGVQCGAEEQFMALGRACGSIEILIHEVGHSLGFFHTHTREDRDEHVKIVWKNVALRSFDEFKKEESLTYGTPYDYLSIMHYGKKTFSRKRGLPTIETLDPLKQYLIGNPSEPSHYDLYIVNTMYRCSKNCVNPPVCLNGGYVDEDCKCTCPHNAAGKTCEIVFAEYIPQVYDQCGNQHLQEDGVIKTLNYPGQHLTDKCLWYLHAPEGKKVQITFDDFSLYPHRRCRVDYIYVMQDLYTEKKRYCGKVLKGKTITAENQSLVIYWRTGYKRGRTGFSATVKFIEDKSNRENKKQEKQEQNGKEEKPATE